MDKTTTLLRAEHGAAVVPLVASVMEVGLEQEVLITYDDVSDWKLPLSIFSSGGSNCCVSLAQKLQRVEKSVGARQPELRHTDNRSNFGLSI